MTHVLQMSVTTQSRAHRDLSQGVGQRSRSRDELDAVRLRSNRLDRLVGAACVHNREVYALTKRSVLPAPSRIYMPPYINLESNGVLIHLQNAVADSLS